MSTTPDNWLTTRGRDRRPSTWEGDGSRLYEADETAAIQQAADLLERVHVPGRDPEPQWLAELVDRDGIVWRKGRHSHAEGWSPEGCPELGLKWTAPAMSHAGPFIGPRVRTVDEVTAAKARAAGVRWDRETGAAA